MRLLILTSLVLALSTSYAAAQSDTAAGEKAYKKTCKVCHSADEGGKNKVGPNLFGIFDAKAGTREGYKYSKALLAKAEDGLVWDEATLQTWLENPQGLVKKSKMRRKTKKAETRDNIIAYLKSLK